MITRVKLNITKDVMYDYKIRYHIHIGSKFIDSFILDHDNRSVIMGLCKDIDIKLVDLELKRYDDYIIAFNIKIPEISYKHRYLCKSFISDEKLIIATNDSYYVGALISVYGKYLFRVIQQLDNNLPYQVGSYAISLWDTIGVKNDVN